MRPGFFPLASAVSVLVSAVLGVLWGRGWRDHFRVGYFDGEARYALHSGGGEVWVSAPPLADRYDAYVRRLALHISNDDIHMNGTIAGECAMSYAMGGGNATYTLDNFLDWRLNTPVAERSLLAALEDPGRVIPAHVELLRTHMRVEMGEYAMVDGVASADLDGLPLRAKGPDGFAEADLSNWRSIGDRWHDRLDRRVVSVDERWLALGCGVLPVLWVTGRVREIRRKRRGGCPSCGYDLTGNVSGVCPECGKAVGAGPGS